MNADSWSEAEFLPRDQTQSQRLHEPIQLIGTIDPITGRDVEGIPGAHYIVDGNLIAYFESNQTLQSYIDLSAARSLRLADNPYQDGEAEG